MNWRRGLIRVWFVLSLLWIGAVGINDAPETMHSFKALYWCPLPESLVGYPKCAGPLVNPFRSEQAKAKQQQLQRDWKIERRNHLVRSLALTFSPPALAWMLLFASFWIVHGFKGKQ